MGALLFVVSALLAQMLPMGSASPGGTPPPPVDSPAITAQTIGTLRNDFAGCVGFEFTPSSNITATQLGRWVASASTQTHILAIVNPTGTALGACSVDASLGTTGTYQYCTLSSSISLSSGTPYFMMSQESISGDQWANLDTTVTPASALAVNNAGYGNGYSGNNCTDTNAASSSNTAFVPTNFKFH